MEVEYREYNSEGGKEQKDGWRELLGGRPQPQAGSLYGIFGSKV